VWISPDDRDTLVVSMNVPCWRDIKDKGSLDSVKAAFGSAVIASEDGFDVTLSYNLKALPSREEELVTSISA